MEMKTLQKYLKHTGAAVVFAFLLLTLLTGCEEKETAEMIENQIKEFEASLTVEKKQLIKSVDLRELNARPEAIYYSKYDSLIYIADTKGSRILIFDADLNYKTEFGGFGQGPLEFIEPVSICGLRNGKIVVTDLRSQKLKIFDKNFNLTYEKRFLGGISINFMVQTDSNDLVYLNLPKEEHKIPHLFIVINDKGDSIDTFGDVLPSSPKKFISADNKVLFDIDENNDIYCAFINNPIFRKYNRKYQLEYEINLDTIPYIKKQYAIWKGKRSGYTHKVYIKGLYVDRNYICIIFCDPKYKYPVLAFDKHTGNIEKMYNFVLGDSVLSELTAFNYNRSDAIYAISSINSSLNKFIK
jgi:hypothetical protein